MGRRTVRRYGLKKGVDAWHEGRAGIQGSTVRSQRVSMSTQARQIETTSGEKIPPKRQPENRQVRPKIG